MAIQAGLLGQEYGMLPTDVMRRPASEFWLNAEIRASVAQLQNEAREEARRNQSSPGVATGRQKKELSDQVEDRADQREEMAESGETAPGMADQLDALEDFDDEGEVNGGDQ